jgi:hypothetical protein
MANVTAGFMRLHRLGILYFRPGAHAMLEVMFLVRKGKGSILGQKIGE